MGQYGVITLDNIQTKFGEDLIDHQTEVIYYIQYLPPSWGNYSKATIKVWQHDANKIWRRAEHPNRRYSILHHGVIAN